MADAEGGSPPAGQGSRPLALIADDSAAFRDAIAAAVETSAPSIRIVHAETGVQARNALLNLRPQLAFVNLQLPEMSGAEALAWAVARGVKPFTVLMSGSGLAKWVELSTELQAYEFLRKPFDPAHVSHMLDARRRMIRPLRLLLAEGSEPARRLIRRVLGESRFRFEIDEAEDGRHALKALRLGAYDLAVIDRHLPRLDGLELACQVAQVAPQTRLMLMAAGDTSPVREAVKQFRIAALLRKPFFVWDMEIALHTAFGLRRPYLLNALPAHFESEAKRLREQLAEARRIEGLGIDRFDRIAPEAPAAQADKGAAVFYI